MKTVAMLVALLVMGSAAAASSALADSLAAGGIKQAAQGNLGQAKELFYKALANNENCADAIFELAKLFDKENNTAAASDFYQRASHIYAQENNPGTVAKRTEANKRVVALNPYAPRLIGIYEDYAHDLDSLVKKVTDSITQEAAMDRVNDLRMPGVLTPEKMPKFYAAAHAKKEADAAAAAAEKAAAAARRTTGSIGSSSTPKAIVNSVPPDVERELKAAGWATITGTWVKKGPGQYETTDGKLEAPKINGVIEVWVHKDKSGAGQFRVAVRNDFRESGVTYSSTYLNDYAGYGISMRGTKEFRLYGPGMYTGLVTSRYEPSWIRSEMIPEANPKNKLSVSIMDGELMLMCNEKKSFRIKDEKIPQNGPFVIEVRGTMTLENPRCAGK